VALIQNQTRPFSRPLGRIGDLEVRLAENNEDIRAAQQLRYKVFYKEMGAAGDANIALIQRDEDVFDQYCDHLLVLDKNRIIGTYRLLLDTKAKLAGGYYSQSEFDLTPILKSNPRLRPMELGRSCVLSAYRNRRIMELLWHGIWAYALQNNVGLMFGCASFNGTNPGKFTDSFSWLKKHASLPESENCKGQPENSIEFSSLKPGFCENKQAFAGLPPLLKGYLRVGAKVASQAVIDHQFGTTDVLVVLKMAEINPRYIAHFRADASRFAA